MQEKNGHVDFRRPGGHLSRVASGIEDRGLHRTAVLQHEVQRRTAPTGMSEDRHALTLHVRPRAHGFHKRGQRLACKTESFQPWDVDEWRSARAFEWRDVASSRAVVAAEPTRGNPDYSVARQVSRELHVLFGESMGAVQDDESGKWSESTGPCDGGEDDAAIRPDLKPRD